MRPRTAVIVSYYHQARELLLVLEALAAQTDREFEVIVADDGSDPPASKQTGALANELGLQLRDVWHADDGFRKASILNQAAALTDAALLIFLDGDCIPFLDLVEVYRGAYREGEFFVGGVGFLDVDVSRELSVEDVRKGRHQDTLSQKERRRFRSVHFRNWLHRGRKQTRPRIRGGNFGVSATLFRQVDGFDEVFSGYGKEDSDLRNRMRNAGTTGISLWTRATAVHLAREVSPSGARDHAPDELYNAGRERIEARIGLSSHLRR